MKQKKAGGHARLFCYVDLMVVMAADSVFSLILVPKLFGTPRLLPL